MYQISLVGCFQSTRQKTEDVEEYRAKRERQRKTNADIWPLLRRLSRIARNRNRGMSIVGDADREIIIPQLNLMALEQLNFLENAKKITKSIPKRPCK